MCHIVKNVQSLYLAVSCWKNSNFNHDGSHNKSIKYIFIPLSFCSKFCYILGPWANAQKPKIGCELVTVMSIIPLFSVI